MLRRLPPLRALLAFESAARNLSFTKAGAELLISEPAVSQHIKLLEHFFGKPLFIRMPRGLELTDDGAALLRVSRECLDRLDEVSRSIRQEKGPRTICIQAPPHFSARWLAPRLGNLIAAKSNIQLMLVHSHNAVEEVSSDVDLCISWGKQNIPGLIVERLLSRHYIPMCSPKLIRGMDLSRPGDVLPKFPLLLERGAVTWDQWLEADGERVAAPATRVEFDNYDVLLQAAVKGQGIALLMYPMFTDHLEAGDLTAPFGLSGGVRLDFNMIYRSSTLKRPEVARVHKWLRREADEWERQADQNASQSCSEPGAAKRNRISA
nr:LysR substrate-binding domain-containing protein [Mesorhizobium sp. WSM4875]